MSTSEPIQRPVLSPETMEALRQWHEARRAGECYATAEGQWCCVDELLGLTDLSDAVYLFAPRDAPSKGQP